MTADPFYITTPIYYANGAPHIGHAYTTVLSDVLARYHRLLGSPTYFLTGTDEHGQKVEQAAAADGIAPQEQVDRMVVHFQDLWRQLEISNDDFIRTTEPRHTAVVQKILQDLLDRDEIYKADYDGWYCVPCERFYTDKDLQEGHCPEGSCGRPVEHITESNYFFRMSKYQDWLIRYIEEHPNFIRPDYRRNETLGFLRQPLQDLCISRPKKRMSWGIELPFDSDFVTYVWFDALVNYVSAIGYQADDDLFNRWWPASVHMIGKDILTTHTVYWPTMLQAMGLRLPETIFAHGWWLSSDSKMGKSMGNAVSPMDMIGSYGVDPFRYFLMTEMTLGQDATFSEDRFVERYNAELANDLGNILNRVMKLIHSSCDGRIPEPGPLGEDEVELRDRVVAAVSALESSLADFRLDVGLGEVAAVVRHANRYMEKRQPWKLAKGGDPELLRTVLYTAAETIRIVGGLLVPVMPTKMTDLRRALGLPEASPTIDELRAWGGLAAGAETGTMINLFPRVKPDVKPAPPTKETTVDEAEEGIARIEFTDFQKVQLRTAKILEAERVEGTDKLMRLQLELGEERRQIVAGIAQHYSAEELVGKTIVVVANLKPARIRKVESNGMLLAASNDGVLRLITADGEIPSGSSVG